MEVKTFQREKLYKFSASIVNGENCHVWLVEGTQEFPFMPGVTNQLLGFVGSLLRNG